jgi:hypothetical protein
MAYNGIEWEMQNDCAWVEDDNGKDILTPALFKKAVVPSNCDWLKFPNRTATSLGG